MPLLNIYSSVYIIYTRNYHLNIKLVCEITECNIVLTFFASCFFKLKHILLYLSLHRVPIVVTQKFESINKYNETQQKLPSF